MNNTITSPLYPYSLLCELTYRCPLQCPYCSNPLDFERYSNNELSTLEWKRILSEASALGIVQVHFSGGEPLLRKDIGQIIKKARDLNLYTNLSTGGTLLTKELAYELHSAGLDNLQISIQDADSLKSDYISGGLGSFEKKKKAALLAKNSGFPLTINVVLHKQNLDNIEAIIGLAEEIGADRLELANTQFNGWALKNRNLLLPTRSQIENAVRKVESARKRLKDKMEILYVVPDYFEQYPKPCLYGWGRVFMTVTSDGTVLPCQTASEIKGLKFENVRNTSLEKIWFESESFCIFRGTDWMPEPCRSCPQKLIDFGGCRCQAFLLTGNAAVTDPVCSLSPYHNIIDQAIEETEKKSTETWIYRNKDESRKLAIKSLFDNK
ncbi:MAG TPA: pyrroloquinoline quinone biosynthesis protein PqqE [Nitrososphaeraceae archaeon]|nr:pyrroloquinoline quinone biosynthesis protein PqqE [Nitrososphaeraceae archaeon]